MDRCFGGGHSQPVAEDFKEFLKQCLSKETVAFNGFFNENDVETFYTLRKAGILVGESDYAISFSSPLARRYYSRLLFPYRADTNPVNLNQLILKTISSLSASILQNSVFCGDFPKEAVFQHVFMEGLASSTKFDCLICPELSRVFPEPPNSNSSTSISGEIDFYLDGSLRWGIELLINGAGISEHIDRFSNPNGKYYPLKVKDYAIIDIRRTESGMPTNIVRHEKRITLFFKQGDFSVARCIFGLEENHVEIRLKD
jgi:hypothetical protein